MNAVSKIKNAVSKIMNAVSKNLNAVSAFIHVVKEKNYCALLLVESPNSILGRARQAEKGLW